MKNRKAIIGGKAYENVSKRMYLGPTFIRADKNHVGKQNLFKKDKEVSFFIQELLIKSKEKTASTHLRMFDSIVNKTSDITFL